MNDIADFPGIYLEARAGLTLVNGKGGLWVTNDKGVTLHLKTRPAGIASALGADGLKIDME
jgi:hypothetical protein